MEDEGVSEKKKEEDFLGKAIDKVFSLDREMWILIFLLLGAFIIRLIFAINTGVTADATIHALHAVNFLDSGKLIDYSQSAGLWHRVTDFFYGIVGVGQFGSRIASIVFGTLSVLGIYLLSGLFFPRKIALISAGLLAFAPFHIRNTLSEMDVMAMFFIIMAFYFFVLGTKKDKFGPLFMAGIFMGLALYTKVYTVLFLPSLLGYFVYYEWKEKKKIVSSRNIKKVALFLFIAFLFTIPTLTHNYLLFKDKGFVDLQFTGALDIGKDKSAQYFGGDGHFNAKSQWKSLIFGNSVHSTGWSTMPALLLTLSFIWESNLIVFVLAMLSLLYILLLKKKDKEYGIFFLLSIGFLWVYLSTIMLLNKHYLFLEILMIPLAAYGVYELSNRGKKFSKYSLHILMLAIIIFSLFSLANTNQIYGKSSIPGLIEFRDKSIPDNALVVADSRIYRGQIYWTLQGRSTLEANQFIQVLNGQDQIPGGQANIPVYFIECVTDDCGWGTIADQPEFNASMEEFARFFVENGRMIDEVWEPKPDVNYYPFSGEDKKRVIYRIWVAEFPLKTAIVDLGWQTKEWFLYPIGHPNPYQEFDAYTAYNSLDTFLDKIAHLIAWLSLWIALFSIIYIPYLVIKNED